MSGADDDLGDFEDDAPTADRPADDIALDVLNEVAETADMVPTVFRNARIAALTPKPKMDEMINVAAILASEIEDRELRAMKAFDVKEPSKLHMRHAAVLLSIRNFLLLCQVNKDAVRRALGGKA